MQMQRADTGMCSRELYVVSADNITIESRDYAESLHFKFLMTIITDHRMARERVISGCLVGKTRENNKVRHNVTQITSLLAIATVFIDFNMDSILQSGGGAYMRDKTTYLCKKIELKMQRGRNRGILRYFHYNNVHNMFWS